jgi:ribosomal protein S18 acetylase RimI-like enzyme
VGRVSGKSAGLNELSGGYSFEYSDQPQPVIETTLRRSIREYNNQVSPAHQQVRQEGSRALDLWIHDSHGQLVGGLAATTYWGWLDIEELWISEGLRHRGFGSQLLTRAEGEAQQRGCRWCMLTTFSFQARGFYERHGYRVVGAQEDYPPGQVYYWMRKELE